MTCRARPTGTSWSRMLLSASRRWPIACLASVEPPSRPAGQGCRADLGLEAELAPDRLQPLDDVQHVLVEWDAELRHALLELVARNLPGEALVLHLLDDGSDVDLVEVAVRSDVGHRDHEAGHLVAGVDRLRQKARPRHAGVISVTEDRLDHVVAIAQTPQLVGAPKWMRVGVPFVIEVMQQARRAPDLELLPADPEPVLA